MNNIICSVVIIKYSGRKSSDRKSSGRKSSGRKSSDRKQNLNLASKRCYSAKHILQVGEAVLCRLR